MSEMLAVKDKVERYLLDLGIRPEVMDGGGWTFRNGSARIFVRLRERQLKGDSTSALVDVFAPVLLDVKPSPELWEYVAKNTDNWIFGHLSAEPTDDGTVTLILSHRLLGDYLDPEELKTAVGGIAVSADEVDDELRQRFGGRRFHEDG